MNSDQNKDILMSTVHILHFPAAWILSVIGSYLPKRIELKLERYRDSQQEYPLYEVHIVEVYKNMMGIQRLSREITLHRLFQHSTEESSIKLRQLEPGSKQIKRHSSSRTYSGKINLSKVPNPKWQKVLEAWTEVLKRLPRGSIIVHQPHYHTCS